MAVILMIHFTTPIYCIMHVNSLGDSITRDIFDAMFMVKHEADEVIIQQGIYNTVKPFYMDTSINRTLLSVPYDTFVY